VDCLNPVQYTLPGLEPAELKAKYGSELTFWGGGIDTQSILPQASPQEVRDEVRRQIEVLAPGGGYVFSQVHIIQADVPPENIVAMCEAVNEYR
jgi:uroporphyrinogen decarboxylase